MALIPITKEDYLDKLNEALGPKYQALGYRFFASPNRLEPGRIDWLRDPKTDPIFIAALEQVESKYRPMVENIKIDNVGNRPV